MLYLILSKIKNNKCCFTLNMSFCVIEAFHLASEIQYKQNIKDIELFNYFMRKKEFVF